jgi:hypothetical protein
MKKIAHLCVDMVVMDIEHIAILKTAKTLAAFINIRKLKILMLRTAAAWF